MSTGMRMTMRTYMMYVADAMMCGLFMMWFSDWVIVQAIICLLLLIGFCMMCYNEGGWCGEKDCTLDRTAEKRVQEGKMDKSAFQRVFNKKHALVCFLAVSIPMCALAAANLIASPNYPEMPPLEQVEAADAQNDPFYYEAAGEQEAEEETVAEPAGNVALRVITRIVFIPLLPLYTILYNHQTVLYILFIPFSFVMPACTAIGYLRGPKIREKKIEEIARGKVRRRKGLLVGANGIQNVQNRGPKQPKPKV